MMGGNEQIVRDSARPDALKSIQLRLALTAIAEAESIEITDEELEAEFTKLAEQYKLDVQMVKNAINPADLKKDLMMTRANDLVMANAVVGEAEAKEEAPAKPKRTRKKKVEAEETAAE